VLAGDGVFTVRARVRQADPHLDRGGAPTPPRKADRGMWIAGPARRAPVAGRPGALRLGFHLEPGMRVGLFGGSFNPVHDGHAHVAETAKAPAEAGPRDLAGVAAEPAEIARRDRRPGGARRNAHVMAKSPGMIVSAVETRLGSTYTIDTIRTLKARFPGVKFVWVMGADSLATFHRWKGWTQILHEVPVAVVSRPWISLKSRFAPAARFARYRRPSQAAVTLPGEPTRRGFSCSAAQLPVSTAVAGPP
jgi:nicotinate-nucleotide adenylyltransferase